MVQRLLLNCDNDEEKLIFSGNAERYPILRLDSPYRVDKSRSFHFPSGLVEYQGDKQMEASYNVFAIRFALKLHQWL